MFFFIFFLFLLALAVLTPVAGVMESCLVLYYFFFLSFLNLSLSKRKSWAEVDTRALSLD